MNKISYLIVSITLILASLPAHAWRDDYDDCIIKSAGDLATSRAVLLLEKSCGNKYFDSAPRDIKIRVISERVDEYRDSDPKFYNYYRKIRNDKSYTGLYSSEIVEHYIKQNGFPKR